MRLEIVGSALLVMGLTAQGNALYKGIGNENWEKAPEAISTGLLVETLGVLSFFDRRKTQEVVDPASTRLPADTDHGESNTIENEGLIPLSADQFGILTIEGTSDTV